MKNKIVDWISAFTLGVIIVGWIAAFTLGVIAMSFTPQDKNHVWVIDKVQRVQLGEDYLWHPVGEAYAAPDSLYRVGTQITSFTWKFVKKSDFFK